MVFCSINQVNCLSISLTVYELLTVQLLTVFFSINGVNVSSITEDNILKKKCKQIFLKSLMQF